VALYEWLLTNYAEEGDRIVDIHLGSGSSAIAAWNLNFDFVGCELDNHYFSESKTRIETHKKQPRLEFGSAANDEPEKNQDTLF